MSLATAQFRKADGLVGPKIKDRGNNNPRDNRNDNRNDRNRNRRWAEEPKAETKKYTPSFPGSTLMNASPRLWGEAPVKKEEKNEPKVEKQEKKIGHQKEREFLEKFKADYVAHKTDARWLADYLVEVFPDLCEIMQHYPEDKWNDIVDSMNGVFGIMSTKQFSDILIIALKRNEMEDWNEKWNAAAITISSLLATNFDYMKEETINNYAYEILASGAMWEREINELVDRFAITKELAIELLIKIPYVGDTMTNLQVSLCYDGLIQAFLAHADENCDVLDEELQASLAEYFFGKDKGLLKMIGQNLASAPLMIDRENPENEIMVALLDEYIKMLYNRLDQFELDQIRYVLMYVVNSKKSNPTRNMVFNVTEAMDRASIQQVVRKLIETNEDAKEYLV